MTPRAALATMYRVRRRRAASLSKREAPTMNANRTTIYLHDGRAWVAELKDGRAQVSSLVAWLSAHPGRHAQRIALEPLPPRAAPANASSGPARGALASLVGRVLGRRASPHPPRDVTVG